MANFGFLFKVEAYKQKDGWRKGVQLVRCTSSGSQETRARRRALQELHRHGWFAKRVQVLDSKRIS